MKIVLRTPSNAKNLASGGVIELRMGRVEKNVIMQNPGCALGLPPNRLSELKTTKARFLGQFLPRCTSLDSMQTTLVQRGAGRPTCRGVTGSAKPNWRAGNGAPLDYVRRAASVSGGGGGAAQPTGARAGGGSLSSRPTTFRRAPGGSSSLDGDANTFVQRGAGRPACRDADLFEVRTMEWALRRLDALCGVAGQAWRHWRTAETIISLPPLSTGEST